VANGSDEEAFVHMDMLRRHGLRELRQGQRVRVRLARLPKGLMVAAILAVAEDTPDRADAVRQWARARLDPDPNAGGESGECCGRIAEWVHMVDPRRDGALGDERGHRLELGPEVLQPCVMLVFQLLDELVELRFLGTDLLSQESGPVLQVPANVTHCCPSFMVLAPTTRRGWQGSRKTERTLPGRRAGQVMQGPRHCLGRGPSLPELKHMERPLSRLSFRGQKRQA